MALYSEYTHYLNTIQSRIFLFLPHSFEIAVANSEPVLFLPRHQSTNFPGFSQTTSRVIILTLRGQFSLKYLESGPPVPLRYYLSELSIGQWVICGSFFKFHHFIIPTFNR